MSWLNSQIENISAQRYNASGVPQGSEFKVNTYTYSAQSSPSITALANGGFVVSWVSYTQDGSGGGIYAQRYDANGVVQGGEFRVNTTTIQDQSEPSITTLINGDFVVTWKSFQDGWGYGIYAKLYSASGIAKSSELMVNTTVYSHQIEPSITALTSGGFVISWTSIDQNGDIYGIYAQRFNASGVKQGSEFHVNTYTPSEQTNSSISALSDGGFIVSWQSYVQDGSAFGVYAQRYDANGIPIDRIVQLNSPPTDINLSNNHINENSATGTQIGTLTSADADNATGFTYTLVGGTGSTDNASFIINGDKILLNTAVNYEVKNSYSVRIKTTDAGGLSYEEPFTISVDDVNDPPHAFNDVAPVVIEAGGVNNGTAGNNISVTSPGVLANDNNGGDFNGPIEVANFRNFNVGDYVLPGNAVPGFFGTLTLNADGSYNYIVNNDHAAVQGLRTSSDTLTERFSYRINDRALD